MDKIFPFLWVTGGECDYAREIKAIKNAGINAFTVESRVHPDFCGDGFFKDFDVIVKTAQKLDMRIWILDDKRYPTGNANGKVSLYPKAKQKHIVCDNLDVVTDGSILQIKAGEKDDSLIAAFAIPHKNGKLILNKAENISLSLNGRWLLPTLKKGAYRIASIYSSARGYERENYIDMLNPASVDVLIAEVYEKFYARYRSEFGKTIVGFFSDEPRLCDGFTTTKFSYGAGSYNHRLGLLGAAYPFSQELEELIKEKLSYFTPTDFLALWYETENYKDIRAAFMNAVTDLYSRNFSRKIGKWCNERGVFYAGHIIEDMNAHTKSGCSAGHYFKSQSGQTLAGVDVVLHQIKPHCLDINHIAATGFVNPDFFSYTMPALAVSDAFLCPDKRGSVCEIFGAYGWAESVKDMKWLADTMLVAGIDHFIPHAFCPETDNEDCPPHFFEGGNNPQYKPFVSLISYIHKILEKTENKFRPKVGVLYHAESDWAGLNITNDAVCRALSENHIPFMIVPHEKIADSRIKALIIPNGLYCPPWVKAALDKAQSLGIKIISSSEMNFKELSLFTPSLKFIKQSKDLRVLFADNILFFQTRSGKSEIEIEDDGQYYLYDIMNDIKTPVQKRFTLDLQAGETRLLVKGECRNMKKTQSRTLNGDYCVSYLQDDNFVTLYENAKPNVLNSIIPDYSGTVKFETDLTVEQSGYYQIEFKQIGGALELLIDGNSHGFRFCNNAAYRVCLEKGSHKLQLLLNNTLANIKKDSLSAYCNIEPFGLSENPTVCKLTYNT